MSEMLQLFLIVVGYQEKIEKVKSQLTMLCTELVKNNEFTHQNKMRLNDFYFNILKNDGIKKEL